MINEQVLFSLADKCDIYFEDLLISKERIIEKYAKFFAASFSGEERCVSIALHTGSICFDIISLITAALGCLALDDTQNKDILDSLEIGQKILYGEKRQSIFLWNGIEETNNIKYISMIQIRQDKHLGECRDLTRVPYEIAKSKITPYYGDAKTTDGRGRKERKSSRSEFLSYMFEISSMETPNVNGVSTVIVAERGIFDRIYKGLQIVYGDNKNIGLLDIVTASYYSDSGEEYRYPGNAAQNDPMLKIVRNVSTARNLVLDKHGNRAVGLMVIDSDNLVKGVSELTDLLGRKALRFVHLTANIDSDHLENIIENQEDAALFACTKEFLLQNSLSPQENNALTNELDRQIENIINNAVSTVIVEGGCSWEDLRKAREALYIIRKSDWNDDFRDKFVIIAYSLINLFLTAVFPIGLLEKAIESNSLTWGVASPSVKILELWDLVNNAGSVYERCIYVANFVERLYNLGFSECSKYDALRQRLIVLGAKKIAVVVPKAYYIDILKTDESFSGKGLTLVNANRFDNSEQYDEIIVIGNFSGKRFDPLKCRAASDITVLLYECEMYWFKHKKQKAANLERKMNSKLGVIGDNFTEIEDDLMDDSIDYENMNRFVEETKDLELYIEKISTIDIAKLVSNTSCSADNILTSEICAVGCFVNGDQILFSKYYRAVVFDALKGTVTEIDAENLTEGDMLVFAKRDDYTKNMVDYIYENLQNSGRLCGEVLDATEKALYWKEVLRKHKKAHSISYRDIAKELQRLGSSLQEASIRQWLIEESHIVGPREESTLAQVAALTQDYYLLNETHSYFEACRIVRRQRKEILGLIGKAITDKLSGHEPPQGSMLRIIYDNVENLSETLELENISFLDEPVTVPINIINKPITEWEVVV